MSKGGSKKVRLIEYMPSELKEAIIKMGLAIEDFREIRIRINRPVIFIKRDGEVFVKGENENYLIADRKMIDALFSAINDYSIYAHSDSIRQGFITICGGHRVGFTGHAVLDNGKIKTISDISSLNIRISHEIKGVSDGVIEKIISNGCVFNTLIISPPGFGKTTLLRDIIRNISMGTGSFKGVNVSVIDERSEIAASYMGVPENDMGIRSDIFDNAPKAEGMLTALRTMAPQVIAVDEIGTFADMEAIRQACKCGCSVIATAHGNNRYELKNNPVMSQIISENYFQRFIEIGKDGTCNVYS